MAVTLRQTVLLNYQYLQHMSVQTILFYEAAITLDCAYNQVHNTTPYTMCILNVFNMVYKL